MTKHILFLSLFLTCPSLSVQISISTALFSHLCLSVLVIPLISAVFLNSHHALSLQFTLSFLRISSTVLHKYENISFNLNFHPGTCFCFIRVHVFWRYVVPPPPFLLMFSLFSRSLSFPLFITPHHLDPPFFSLHRSLSTCWFQSQRVEANLRTSALSRKRWCHLFQRWRARLALSHDTDTLVYTMPPLFKTDSLR